MSPNEHRIVSGRFAIAIASSISASGVTQTGHPGPCTSSTSFGQQLVDALPDQRVGLPAADLHDRPRSRRDPRDVVQQRARDVVVAVLVEVLHATRLRADAVGILWQVDVLQVAHLLQQRVGASGLLLVHHADREPHVDHDPVVEPDLRRVLQARLALDPAEVHGPHADPVLLEDLDHLPRNAEAHLRPPPSVRSRRAPGRARSRRRPPEPLGVGTHGTPFPSTGRPSSEVKQIVVEHPAAQHRAVEPRALADRPRTPERWRPPACRGTGRRPSAPAPRGPSTSAANSAWRVDLHQAVARPRRAPGRRAVARCSGALLQEHRWLPFVATPRGRRRAARPRRRTDGRPSWSTGSRDPSGAGHGRPRPRPPAAADAAQPRPALPPPRRTPSPSARDAVSPRRRRAAAPVAGARPAPRSPRRSTEQLPAPDRPVVAQAEPVERDAEHLALQARARPCRGDVRVMVLDGDRGHARAPRRTGWSRSPGAGRAPRARAPRGRPRGSGRARRGRRPSPPPCPGRRCAARGTRAGRSPGRTRRAARLPTPSVGTRHAASRARSTTARSDRARRAPTAGPRAARSRRPGRRSARRSRGRAPRTRRRCLRGGRAPRRSRCRSARRSGCRSSSRAAPEPRGAGGGAAGWTGSIAPLRRWPGATPGASRPRSATSTIGARQEPSAAASSLVGSNHSRAASRSRTITANGLSGRRLRRGARHRRARRSRRTPGGSPPSPLIATIAPSASIDATRSTTSPSIAGSPSASRSSSVGRTRDTPRARRGIGGRPGPRTRAGTSRTSGRRACCPRSGRTGGTR